MKKKDKTPTILVAFLVIFTLVWGYFFVIPEVKSINRFFSPDSFDEKYHQVWNSEDGQISFVATNKYQMMQDNVYQGVLIQNNQEYTIDIIVGLNFSRAWFTEEKESTLFSGNASYNDFLGRYTIYITEASDDLLNYHVGDEIVFVKAN